jgi:cytosine/adenosine deaminase-related metal-dependent hydrolase
MRASLAPAIQNQNKYVYLHEEKFLSSLPQKTIKALQLKQFSETENRKRIENYFRIFKKTQETHKKNNRVKLLLGPTGVQWCTDELLKRIKKESDKMGVGIHMHLQESMYQRDYGYKLYEKSPLQHLKDIEFIGPEVSFAHGVWLSEEDMRLISDSGASVVHNPSSNLRLFNGVAPIPEMIKNNVKVSLGIDGTGINDDDDILQEMRLCSVIHRKPGIKQYELFSKTLTAPKIFDMATKQGAQTTGYGSEIGSIEIGKKADLVLINSKRIEPLIFPGTCLEDLILNWVKSEDISSVMVDGKLLMHERKMIGLDEETIFNDLTAERREQEREVKNQLQKYKEYLKNYYKNW